MPTINGGVCVVNGKPVDKVYSNDKQVYGRNLLLNTSNSATNGNTVMKGSVYSVMGTYSRTDSYEQITTTSNNNEFYYRFVTPAHYRLYNLTLGEAYTLSGSISHTTGILTFRAEYFVKNRWIPLEGVPRDLGNPVSDGSVFTPFSFTFTFPVEATGAYFSFQVSNFPQSGGLFRFKNMKLEKGNVATPWTPAPEDVGITD